MLRRTPNKFLDNGPFSVVPAPTLRVQPIAGPHRFFLQHAPFLLVFFLPYPSEFTVLACLPALASFCLEGIEIVSAFWPWETVFIAAFICFPPHFFRTGLPLQKTGAWFPCCFLLFPSPLVCCRKYRSILPGSVRLGRHPGLSISP